ncbi:MAG: tyrosine-type recombinase/integrase [bacterium]
MKPYRKASGSNPDGTQRLSPHWWISYVDASKRRVHESTKTESLTEAKRILADRQAAVRAQGMVFDNLKRVYLFEELAGDYLTWQSVQNQREAQLKHRLLPLIRLLGKKDLNRISSEDLVAYRVARSKECSGRRNSSQLVSQTSINRELAVLGAAYNWARGEAKYQDVIKRNPFVRRKHLTKVPVKVRGWFDPDGKRRFLEACEQLPADRKHFPPLLLKSIFLVLVGTGMRIVECLSLRKRQVKLDYRLVQLEGWQTKNKKAGDVDLRTDEAFHVFRVLCQGKKDGDLVFQWPEGDSLRQPERCKVRREPGQIPYSAVASAFRAACTKAGLEGVSLHSTRKTAATEMAIEGYSPVEIKNLLHHKDLSTTLLYINETAVNGARRQERMRLKLSALSGDTTAPLEEASVVSPNSATQAPHKASGRPS